jgi:DNA-binding transcriptional LysR family regulator
MDWNDVRHFLALARSGSVRAAGASLGVSHSTVARRVEALEEKLAARLFDRNRDGYVLTEAGRQMLPGAERIEREMAALERGLVGQDERLAGSVSLTCCDHFVSDLLVRELSGFCDEFPDIELSFTTDSRLFDLSKRDADIAIRTTAKGAQPPEHLLGTKLAPLVVANYVARDHAARLDPDSPGSRARWVAFDDRRTVQAMIDDSSYPDVPAWGAFSTLELMVQAAREGLGLVMLPTYVGDREPALRRLAKPDLRHLADLWLLCHPDLRDNARIRAARTRVAEALRNHLPLFRGEGWPMAAPVCT